MNYLFQEVPPRHMICLKLGTLEVIAIFVRRKNAHRMSLVGYQQAMINFRQEVLDMADIAKITATDAMIDAALPLVGRHSINATDAVILRSALDLASRLRITADDLILVTSDQRLMRAGQVEGLVTFDPESQDQVALDALLAP